jgi:hypothetical protein
MRPCFLKRSASTAPLNSEIVFLQTKKLHGSAMKARGLLFVEHGLEGLHDAGRKLINKSQDHWVSGKCSRLTSSTGWAISLFIVSDLLKAKQENGRLLDFKIFVPLSIWFCIVCCFSQVNLSFKVDSIALRFR